MIYISLSLTLLISLYWANTKASERTFCLLSFIFILISTLPLYYYTDIKIALILTIVISYISLTSENKSENHLVYNNIKKFIPITALSLIIFILDLDNTTKCQTTNEHTLLAVIISSISVLIFFVGIKTSTAKNRGVKNDD
jgi:hypothetical protein